jgi:5'-3' exonuclease
MNLIVDGNSMMNVTANVVTYTMRSTKNMDTPYITVGDRKILKDSSKRYFRSFILKYMMGVFAPIRSSVEKVYIVFDSVSWRKFFVDKYFERNPNDLNSFVYKGQRKDSEAKQEIFMFISYFMDEMMPEIAALPGIHSIRAKGAEGDDVIAVLTEDIKDDVAIWSGDGDMSQLVHTGDRYVIVLGPKNKEKKRKMFLPVGYGGAANLSDFSVDDRCLKEIVKFLSSEKEYAPVEIEPNDYIMRKILMGDESDNIPSIYTKITKGLLHMRVTDLKASNILQILSKKRPQSAWQSLVDSKDDSFADDVTSATLDGLALPSIYRANVKEHYFLNSRIMRLSTVMIPPEMTKVIRYKAGMADARSRFDYQKFVDYALIDDLQQQ